MTGLFRVTKTTLCKEGMTFTSDAWVQKWVTISFQSVFPTSVTLGVRLSSKVSLVLTFLYLCEWTILGSIIQLGCKKNSITFTFISEICLISPNALSAWTKTGLNNYSTDNHLDLFYLLLFFLSILLSIACIIVFLFTFFIKPHSNHKITTNPYSDKFGVCSNLVQLMNIKQDMV